MLFTRGDYTPPRGEKPRKEVHHPTFELLDEVMFTTSTGRERVLEEPALPPGASMGHAGNFPMGLFSNEDLLRIDCAKLFQRELHGFDVYAYWENILIDGRFLRAFQMARNPGRVRDARRMAEVAESISARLSTQLSRDAEFYGKGVAADGINPTLWLLARYLPKRICKKVGLMHMQGLN